MSPEGASNDVVILAIDELLHLDDHTVIPSDVGLRKSTIHGVEKGRPRCDIHRSWQMPKHFLNGTPAPERVEQVRLAEGQKHIALPSANENVGIEERTELHARMILSD